MGIFDFFNNGFNPFGNDDHNPFGNNPESPNRFVHGCGDSKFIHRCGNSNTWMDMNGNFNVRTGDHTWMDMNDGDIFFG